MKKQQYNITKNKTKQNKTTTNNITRYNTKLHQKQ